MASNMLVMQSKGIMICSKCGLERKVMMNSEKLSYREPVREQSYFAYKRINHFNESQELVINYFIIVVFKYVFIFNEWGNI